MNGARDVRATRITHRKKKYDLVVPLNLTFSPAIIRALNELVVEGGYKGPADYFAAKVRRDKKMDAEDRVAA